MGLTFKSLPPTDMTHRKELYKIFGKLDIKPEYKRGKKIAFLCPKCEDRLMLWLTVRETVDYDIRCQGCGYEMVLRM